MKWNFLSKLIFTLALFFLPLSNFAAPCSPLFNKQKNYLNIYNRADQTIYASVPFGFVGLEPGQSDTIEDDTYSGDVIFTLKDAFGNVCLQRTICHKSKITVIEAGQFGCSAEIECLGDKNN